MIQHICVGVHSEIIYLEGSRPEINRKLLEQHPSFEIRKVRGASDYREMSVYPILHEPVRIRKADDYYAELEEKAAEVDAAK